MSLSRAEFARILPGAVRDGTCRDEADGFAGETGDGRWRIRLNPLPALDLGSLAMERFRVELELEHFSASRAEAFINRFLATFQRGGG